MSSAVALERTAIGCWAEPERRHSNSCARSTWSSSWADGWLCSNSRRISSAARCCSETVWLPRTRRSTSAARRLCSMCSRYAMVVTAKPAGTWNPSRTSHPSAMALPPTSPTPSGGQSFNQTTCGSFRMYRHQPVCAIDGDQVAGLDPRRPIAGTHDGGQPVFAADDRRVTHDAANIRHGALDGGKDGRPRRLGHRTHQDLALLHLRQLID